MLVGVDVGGTKVLAVALADDTAVVVRRVQLPMPGRTASEDELEGTVVEAVRAVATDTAPTGVGIAAAGLVDAAGERVRFAAHLPWRDAPVRARIATALECPVVLDNDATCAGHAELVAGAARGADTAVLLTLGTGIGGAVVIGGRLHRGAGGMAGEFGHMQVVPDGLACECGLRGCWEQYCSGRALERVMRVAVGSHLDGPEIAERARAGDSAAQGAFAAVGTWLGVGLAGLVSALDPELVVVGGGVSVVGDLLLDPAREALAASLQAADRRVLPPIVPARFGSEAGAIGAALLARSADRLLE